MDESLNQGFWHTVMGLLAHPGKATISRITELAQKLPSPVTLSRPDAIRILNLAKLARSAGADWLAGRLSQASQVPSVRLPAVPNIEGGNSGEYQASLIIRPFGELSQSTNVVFSSNKLPSVQQALENIRGWVDENCSKKYDQKFQDFCDQLKQVPQNWLKGRGDIVVPNWIIRGAQT